MALRRLMPADYVAIITDGNGRWAQQRGLPVIEGHQAGADVVKERLRDAVEFGVKELTVYSFSTENWTRPKEEVDGLMAMFAERIDSETPELERGGRADALHRPPRGHQRGAHRAHGLGRGRDRRQRPDHAVRRLQLRRPGGDPRRGRRVRGGRRGGVPGPPLRARDARPRPADPHQRRAADLELPALAVRLLRVRLPRRALAGLHPGGVRGLPAPSTRSASGASGRGSDDRGPRPALVPVRPGAGPLSRTTPREPELFDPDDH